jgi:hypothetical protein
MRSFNWYVRLDAGSKQLRAADGRRTVLVVAVAAAAWSAA